MAGILGGIIVEVIIALISLGMGAAGVLFVGKRHGGSHADALPPRINLVENNYGRIYVERDPVAPPSRVGSGTPIRAHADVSTGAGTVQAGPWSKPEMVARLDTAAHTAHIGTTRGEMVLPLGPEPRAHEPMLQAVLEWLIEKDLLAALPNTTPPPPKILGRIRDGELAQPVAVRCRQYPHFARHEQRLRRLHRDRSPVQRQAHVQSEKRATCMGFVLEQRA